jgi:RNA recognition motif-containing protein
MSIYVGNLSYEITQEHLSQTFAEYGTVKRIQLPTDRETGRLRGFAFVEMSSEAEEEKAIEALDGAEWMGRDLKVNKAKPREERRPGGGGGGGWGGNNRGGGGGGGGGGRGGRY